MANPRRDTGGEENLKWFEAHAGRWPSTPWREMGIPNDNKKYQQIMNDLRYCAHTDTKSELWSLPEWFPCRSEIEGRYVQLQRRTAGWFGINEIQVKAKGGVGSLSHLIT